MAAKWLGCCLWPAHLCQSLPVLLYVLNRASAAAALVQPVVMGTDPRTKRLEAQHTKSTGTSSANRVLGDQYITNQQRACTEPGWIATAMLLFRCRPAVVPSS